jgi:hypothetical protein
LPTIHAGELRKRVSNGCAVPRNNAAELLIAHAAGINNAVASMGGKEMKGTTKRHARPDSQPQAANR